jgi:hypothetical protein
VIGTYSGDSEFPESTGSATLEVGPTETTVTVSPSFVVAGADVTYSATVASVPADGVPAGTVAFSYEGLPLCSATLVGGTGSCTTVSDGGVGDATVVGTYSGASGFAGSSGSTTLVETGIPTRTTTVDTVEYGQTVAFSADVVPVGDYGPPYAGTVSFSIGATTFCTASLTDGQLASCMANNVPWGADIVTATYSGSSQFLGSSSSQSLFVPQVSVSSVSVDPNQVSQGQSVTYTATVTSPTASGTPAGTVAFSVGSTALCSATLVGGTASCSSTDAPVGTDAATATYSGDSQLAGSIGWTTLTVGAPFAINSPPQSTFVVGDPVSFAVTTTTGFPTPVISESGTLPSGVTFTDNGNGTAVLSGTPAAGTAGSYPITITAVNGIDPDATQTFSLTVVPAGGTSSLGITTTSLPDGSVYSKSHKVNYSDTLSASGGNPPYKWSLATGSSLPPGLKLSTKGLISGKATTAGSYSFTVQVVDTKTRTKPYRQNEATATLSITIG